MPETLTFIHAADLHIGAPFRGLRALSDEWARRLVDAIPGAWDRVVEAAVSGKVDFVVVSGDIFDSVRASYRDYLRFFDGLNRLDAEGIPSYLCTGNHVGGRAYLAELADNTFSLTRWERHVDIVKRQSILRELVFAATQINALAYDAPDDLDQVVEEAEKTLFNVTEKRVSSSFRKMDELVSDAYEEISRLANQKDKMAGVPTGFKDVDELFHGFRGGDLVILAARPGVGKTSFALNLATNAAKAGAAVAFFSLEMGAEQLVQRILCSEARVNLSKLRSGFIAEGDWGALAEASGKLSQLDMFIDDTPGLSVLEARAKGRRELHGLKEGQKGLIIVDYLQLMQPGPMTANKSTNDQVSEISRGLKILAKEMNMPVLALSQLSRAIEQRGKDKRPMLSDLRDSGAIEQDADIVMFIDRSMNEIEAESESRPDLGMAKLIVAKHRNGATRDIDLAFNPEFTKFMDFIDDSRVGSF